MQTNRLDGDWVYLENSRWIARYRYRPQYEQLEFYTKSGRFYVVGEFTKDDYAALCKAVYVGHYIAWYMASRRERRQGRQPREYVPYSSARTYSARGISQRCLCPANDPPPQATDTDPADRVPLPLVFLDALDCDWVRSITKPSSIKCTPTPGQSPADVHSGFSQTNPGATQ